MQIIFIRHAEKDTNSNPVHLSKRGYQRANLFPEYFLHPYGEFNIPNKFYVMCRIKEHRSDRCFETMLPTISKSSSPLELIPRIDTYKFAKRLYKDRCKNETVLVCWQHSRIVDMLNILGANTVIQWGTEPETNKNQHCFDATWVVDLTDSSLMLRVYRQFDIDDNGHATYINRNRNDILFEKIYFISKDYCSIV